MKKILVLLICSALLSCAASKEAAAPEKEFQEELSIDNYYGECFKYDKDGDFKITIDGNIMVFHLLDENKKVITPIMEGVISKISESEAILNIRAVYFSDYEMGRGAESPDNWERYTKESLVDYYVSVFGDERKKAENDVEDLFFAIDYEYKFTEKGTLVIDPDMDDRLVFSKKR